MVRLGLGSIDVLKRARVYECLRLSLEHVDVLKESYDIIMDVVRKGLGYRMSLKKSRT